MFSPFLSTLIAVIAINTAHLLVLIEVTESQLLTYPINVAAIQGSSVTLNCSYYYTTPKTETVETNLFWLYTNDSSCLLTPSSCLNMYIYSQYSTSIASWSRTNWSTHVINDKGKNVSINALTIHPIDIRGAGSFMCAEYSSDALAYYTYYPNTTGQLIVLDSQPNCSISNLPDSRVITLCEQDTLQVQCTVNYSCPNCASFTKFALSNGSDITSTWFNIASSSMLNVISNVSLLYINTSSFRLAVDRSMNRLSVIATTSFITHPAMSNLPYYTISIVVVNNMTVLFCPQCSISSSNVIHGEPLNCSALNNLPPGYVSYTWFDVTTNRNATMLPNATGSTLSGANLTLGHVYECIATGTTCTALQNCSCSQMFIVIAQQSTTSETATLTTNAVGSRISEGSMIGIIVGSVVGGILVIVVMVVVVVCIVRSKGRPGKRKGNSSAGLTNDGVDQISLQYADDSIQPYGTTNILKGEPPKPKKGKKNKGQPSASCDETPPVYSEPDKNRGKGVTQDGAIPIYTEVNKNNDGAGNGVPVIYSECNKDNVLANTDRKTQYPADNGMATYEDVNLAARSHDAYTPPQPIVGADGTIYAPVPQSSNLAPNKPKPPKKPSRVDEGSTYAAVTHMPASQHQQQQ